VFIFQLPAMVGTGMAPASITLDDV